MKKWQLRPQIKKLNSAPASSTICKRSIEKALPNPPYFDPYEGAPPPLPKDTKVLEAAGAIVNVSDETSSSGTEKPLHSRPTSRKSVPSQPRPTPDVESDGSSRKAKHTHPVLKKCTSFASLRKASSRRFRSNVGYREPPPPPLPQIPIDIPTAKSRRPVLRPFDSFRSPRLSHASQSRIASISRPISAVQSQLPNNFDPYKVTFTKPTGPPPPRPARPGSVDEDLVAMRQDGVARTLLHTPQRTRISTVSSISSVWSPALSRVGSEEAYTRLGLPSGHSSLSPPLSPIFDSPLAANFPIDPGQPLPFRDSDGSVLGYGRFSAYIKARQQYSSGGYDDGVEAGDRDLGPIELYRESKCGNWTLETSVSGMLGERGMVFRDRWGGWHVVRDV